MECDDRHGHDGGQAPTRLHSKAFWLLGRAARIAQHATAERLAAVGLRRYYYGVLATIDEFGPAAQAEIGRRLGIDPSDMVAALGELEREGYVERERDPTDRRRNRVELTRAGKRALARFDQAIAETQRELLAGFSKREEQALITLLQRLVAKEGH